MNFHCLGTNGFHSSETSHTACYMIPEIGLVFDAGCGFFRVPKLVQTEYLDIFLSHGHLDHIFGIHSVLEIYELSPCKTIRVHAEQKVLDGIKVMFKDPFFPASPPLQLIPLVDGEADILPCGAKITHFPLKHTTTCYGYRFEHNGKSFAYVTDTTSTTESTYLSNLQGLDYLFHEVHSITAEGSEKYGHTCAESLAKVCNIVKPSKLFTIHHNPMGDRYEVLKAIKKEFPNAHATEDKMIIMNFI